MTRLAVLAVLALAVLVPPAAALTARDAADLAPRLGARLPLDTPFTESDGRPILLGEAIGRRPTILAPVYYRCPNVCGLTLSGLFTALRGTGFEAGRDYDVVAFSIDPAEDAGVAARTLRDQRDRFPEIGSGVRFLTGRAEASRAVADAMGFSYAYDPEIGQYAHPAAVAVTTPDGTISRYLRGLAPDAFDVRLALVEAGDGRIGNVIDNLRVLCFAYDPVTGRYSPAIWTILQAVCGLTVLVMAVWLAGAWRGGRRPRTS